jgi:hypothetical protein
MQGTQQADRTLTRTIEVPRQTTQGSPGMTERIARVLGRGAGPG